MHHAQVGVLRHSPQVSFETQGFWTKSPDRYSEAEDWSFWAKTALRPKRPRSTKVHLFILGKFIPVTHFNRKVRLYFWANTGISFEASLFLKGTFEIVFAPRHSITEEDPRSHSLSENMEAYGQQQSGGLWVRRVPEIKLLLMCQKIPSLFSQLCIHSSTPKTKNPPNIHLSTTSKKHMTQTPILLAIHDETKSKLLS